MTEPDAPDRETLREIAEEIDRLMEAADRVRELGEAAGIPAVERNAKRVADTATTLVDNVPPELHEE